MFDLSENLSIVLLLASLILGSFSLAIAVVSLVKAQRLKKLNQALLSGKDGKSLEGLILKQDKEIKELDKEIQELFEISNSIHQLAHRGIQKVGLVRFNPFKDIGGDQSFALALLNGKKSGVVLSSLHTREGTRIYAKPVQQGSSKKYQLTDEELKAIESADVADKSVKKEV